MRRPGLRILAAVVACTLALVGVGCGDDDPDPDSETDAVELVEGTPGGHLTYLAAGDIDFLDPGQTNYTFGFMVNLATNRMLYSYMPDDSVNPVPDLADGDARIGDDGRTLTIRIRRGVRYAPPVDREITADDFKYAIERAFSKNVPNGYAGVYFSAITGAPRTAGTGPIRPISGIETPDDHTLVIRLDRPVANLVRQALALPISTPVPREYAAPFDARTPTDYERHVAFTGPYMVRNDARGRIVGRRPGRLVEMVRNPNWDAETDFRPAYLDRITIRVGNPDVARAARGALTGESTVCCDGGSPPAEVLTQALSERPDQVVFVPSGGTRYIAMNTTVAPFDNLNIRKAVIAATDRVALRGTRGGDVVGDVATGWIPPGLPGFEESGGYEQNTDLDYLASPTGDAAVARKYMDAAAADGLPVNDGRWAGGRRILTVATNADPGRRTARVFREQMRRLGFDLDLRTVPQEVLYTRFCGVPAEKVAICPSVSWYKDFSDLQAMLDPTFNGRAILQTGNVNWAQLNDPVVNDALDRAALEPVGGDRNVAFAEANRLIAEQAPAVPWLWDKTAFVYSTNVSAVANGLSTTLDLSFTSLR